MKKSLIDRLLDRTEIITESGCWIFLGATNEAGYGLIGLGERSKGIDRVHRVVYRHFIGEITDNKFVCHKCDIPSCCNPNHLFLGTPKENVADMISKKRGSTPPRNMHDIGSYRYNSKLTEEMVLRLRNERNSGLKTAYRIWKELDAEIGINQSCVRRMLDGLSWKHVKC